NEVEIAFENNEIGLHTRILIPAKKVQKRYFTDDQLKKYLVTTYGKIIFNTIFPNDKYTILLDVDHETGEARKEERYIPFINEANVTNLTDKLDDKYFISPRDGNDVKELIKK